MPDPSFYYAIFKRLQGTAASHAAHMNDDNDPKEQFYGGFSLKHAGRLHGAAQHGALGTPRD